MKTRRTGLGVSLQKKLVFGTFSTCIGTTGAGTWTTVVLFTMMVGEGCCCTGVVNSYGGGGGDNNTSLSLTFLS